MSAIDSIQPKIREQKNPGHAMHRGQPSRDKEQDRKAQDTCGGGKLRIVNKPTNFSFCLQALPELEPKDHCPTSINQQNIWSNKDNLQCSHLLRSIFWWS